MEVFMGKKYPGLLFVSSLMRVVGVIVILAGVVGSLWWYRSIGEYDSFRLMVLVGVIIGSLVVGLVVYASGDLLRCVMDIEENTRAVRMKIGDKNLEERREDK
jgi:hypothetical protein